MKRSPELLKKLEDIADAILVANGVEFSNEEIKVDADEYLRFNKTYLGFREKLNTDEWQRLATVRIAENEILQIYCLYYSEIDGHKSAWFSK